MDLLKCLAFFLVGGVCAIFALGLHGLMDAHGHGIPGSANAALFFLYLISVIFFVVSIKYLKRIISK